MICEALAIFSLSCAPLLEKVDDSMIVTQLRSYEKDQTTSRIFLDGELFGSSLEDTGRPAGVKIKHETCIPEGAYKVTINRSGKFQKDMIMLYNIDIDMSVDREGIRFTGIRVHGGSSISHTSGCVLIPDYEILQAKIQDALDDNQMVLWVITGDV